MGIVEKLGSMGARTGERMRGKIKGSDSVKAYKLDKMKKPKMMKMKRRKY